MSFISQISQKVVADANNSSTTNLAVGNTYTFTGTKTSTLGVAGIQVSLFANQNCKILVEQSPNGTNWDLIDTFYYTASGNFGTTVQAVSSWVRVVVTTNNLTTSTFRLQTALCPIVEAVPRSLDVNGRFKISTPADAFNFKAFNTSLGEIRTAEPVRLAGAIFDGTTIDSRFWTTAAAGTAATIAQGNTQMTITSGTSNGATVTMFSVRRGRYVAGHSIRYRAAVQVSAGLADNTRRWGLGWGSTAMPTVTDGAYFAWSGTTFQVVTMKTGTPSAVSAFNGNLGATFDPGTNAKTYEIYYTATKVYFVVDGELLHTVDAAADTWADTKSFHIFADSVNTGAIGASTTLKVRTAAIHRFGPLSTEPNYYNLTGNAATHVIKRGPGKLQRIVFNNTSGTSFVIYDNVSATTPTIGSVTTASTALGSWLYDCPFFNGLTIVTTGNSLDLTVVYE